MSQLLLDIAAYTAHTESERLGIGPSDIGRCRREVGYRIRGEEPDADYLADPTERALNRLSMILGTVIHDLVAAARKFAHPTWLVEEFVKLPGMPRPGKVDAYKDDEWTVDDLKTTSGRAMEQILNLGRARDGDRAQANLYALGLEDEGHEVRTVSVTYLDRAGTSKPFVDDWSFSRDEALTSLDRLHAVQDALDEGLELPRDGNGPGVDWKCDHCPFVKTCWGTPRVGYSPQSDRLASEEVRVLAARLVAVKQQASALKGEGEFLRASMVGHGGERFEDEEGITRRVAWSKNDRLTTPAVR